jgi:hypothetical protein
MPIDLATRMATRALPHWIPGWVMEGAQRGKGAVGAHTLGQQDTMGAAQRSGRRTGDNRARMRQRRNRDSARHASSQFGKYSSSGAEHGKGRQRVLA